MNKQELIKNLNFARDSSDNEDDFRSGVRTGLALAIFEIEQLDEPAKPSKPVIPQFVADYLETAKKEISLLRVFEIANGFSELDMWHKEYNWIRVHHLDFARAWLDGYEIEKEKLYSVIIPTKRKGWKYHYLDDFGGINATNNLKNVECHTEDFIRSISDDLWHFAVEVAE